MVGSVDDRGARDTAQFPGPPGGAAEGPAVALLSNGSYSVLLTTAGAGCGSWRGLDVTRWREDCTRDCWGQFCYVRDRTQDKLWSIGRQPLFRPGVVYDNAFHGDRAEFRCLADDIDVSWAACVAPDMDVEVRLLTISNHGAIARSLELTSYAEVSLNNRRADRAHPAFTKLFVETQFDQRTGALLARRRPRSAEEKPVWAVHVSSSSTQDRQPIEYETDRLKFLGRCRTTANPLAFDREAGLSGTVGPVLDPVFCLRTTVQLQPGASERVAFVTGAADDEAMARTIASRYSGLDAADKAFSDATESYRSELQGANLTPEEVALFNRLAGSILFVDRAHRDKSVPRKKPLSRAALWSHGISGDLPIVLARIEEDGAEPLIGDVIRAHGFIAGRGLRFDLVLLDERDASAAEPLAGELNSGPQAELVGKPGGIYLLPAGEGSHDLKDTVTAAARIVLSSSRGALADQLGGRKEVASPAARISEFPSSETSAEHSAGVGKDLLFWNGFGGFSADGREYVIVVDGIASPTPTPWCNVIANADFGCLTSESGMGCTWAGNSQLNRLTPWSNDPVSDPPGDVVYLRDEETGELWTPTPLPLGHGAAVTVRHRQGQSLYESDREHLHQELAVHVPVRDSVKVMRLAVRNDGAQVRHLTATYFAEWVLGTQREDAPLQVVCERDLRSGAIVARNAWEGDFSGRLAFAAASRKVRSATCNRSAFLGARGSVSQPAGLEKPDLEGQLGDLADPCAALMVDISIARGESAEVVFLLGQAGSLDEVRALVREYAEPKRARHSLAIVSRQWDDILSAIEVKTPDPAFDLMMNRWLLYQVLACRVWGRSAFYQSGGAFGFRDQLQDVMALVHSAPNVSRSHILRAAGRQFEEGDVQHWWHPPSGVGVRTRITDDLYFLPFVVHHYVSTTGDVRLLDERVPFITAPVLREDQEEHFGIPERSEQTATVYEHCVRALEHGFRLGRHGLPLMGTGDWNDGMNKVGAGGRGESVWNGWFFLTVLQSFATIASSHRDESRAKWCLERSEELRAALEARAWDGGWYRRAFFDDGTPLGSSANDECQIDAIPQAWAVISGSADRERASRAMDAVHERLVRRKDKLIQLFDPPFDKGSLQPGYIKGYVPGIRENGGQYTHAATWVVLASALQGDGDGALELWNLLNPINHASTKRDAEHYMVEPFVVSADVYGAPPHTGRGGWTWYTGSAAWLYRVGLEAILGFRRQDNILSLEPCIPTYWPAYDMNYRYGSATYRIHVDNKARVCRGLRSLVLDDGPLTDAKLPLVDDGRLHDVRAILG
ncbi:GH36-type glycosyl hydrolase domain-containing protein [Sinorhizobium fredii]|uniref:Glycosyl transferase n=3 Tax=Rhizobium fredii TaxID=380 RepID=A0A844AIN5_RHIFR|nr:glycosyl transferase [Sinorhizobium fredii]MQX12959.1 glycosyl transferase [Sinorhizobium fredii]GEC32954.1 glycosyl transferase [Sinorhizobium fredii]GLS10570.1 glycosyl transferase [Sinorhizobium fredii]